MDLWIQEKQRLKENQTNPCLHKICNELQHLAGTMLSTERAEAAQASQHSAVTGSPGETGLSGRQAESKQADVCRGRILS